MKKRDIIHAYEEAKIYQDYYRPSFNILRLIKSVLALVLFGSAPAAQGHVYNKKTGR